MCRLEKTHTKKEKKKKKNPKRNKTKTHKWSKVYNRDSHFLIRGVFFVSKGNLFDVYFRKNPEAVKMDFR